MEEYFKKADWHVYDLHMTEDGFHTFRNEVLNQRQIQPQVYVHISVDKVLNKQVLRIGRAQNGIQDRWIRSSSGHGSTFLWSIGKSRRYASNAGRYPNYIAFFGGLVNLHTKLCVHNCESVEEMNKIEKELIQHCSPIWERYKQPIREYFSNHPEIKERMSVYGGGQKEMIEQREGVSIFTVPIPDVTAFDIGNSKCMCNFEKWE